MPPSNVVPPRCIARWIAPFACFSATLSVGCDGAGASALVVSIRSSLEIPAETDTLVVRIVESDGTSTERSYGLGEPPRDAWPQTLPVLPGRRGGERVTIAGELRVSVVGMPSVVVGYGETAATLPERAQSGVDLDIPPACIDADGDSYGTGFGCKRPDCDDTRSDVPDPNFCSGVRPPPPDGGPRDGGAPPAPDSGVPARRDGGTPASPCDGSVTCAADETCLGGQCYRRCRDTRDCREVSYGCLDRLGVCICRVPCATSNDCGPYTCVDRCCQIR